MVTVLKSMDDEAVIATHDQVVIVDQCINHIQYQPYEPRS